MCDWHTICGNALVRLSQKRTPMLVESKKPWWLVSFVYECVCVFVCILALHSSEAGYAQIWEMLPILRNRAIARLCVTHLVLVCSNGFREQLILGRPSSQLLDHIPRCSAESGRDVRYIREHNLWPRTVVSKSPTFDVVRATKGQQRGSFYGGHAVCLACLRGLAISPKPESEISVAVHCQTSIFAVHSKVTQSDRCLPKMQSNL